MSVFTHILAYVGAPATLLLAFGTLWWRVSRARLLWRAGDTALEKGSEDPQGKAGLEIVKALTGDEPWYRQILGRKPDDG